jgi:hypothetical protein
MVILQRTRPVKRARDHVKKRLLWRLEAWDSEKYDMLVQDTERDIHAFLSPKQRGTTTEQRIMIYHRMVMRGKLRQAVRYLTDREKDIILIPDDLDEKT